MTSSFSSRRTAPCIWPEKPTAAMASALSPESWSALRTAMAAARHQSRGSCSAQPGCGLAKLACSSVPEARTAPSSSRMTARVPLVPTSMPRMGIWPPSYTKPAGDFVSGTLLAKGENETQKPDKSTLQRPTVNVHGGHLRPGGRACQRSDGISCIFWAAARLTRRSANHTMPAVKLFERPQLAQTGV